jgi:hypothetical protein
MVPMDPASRTVVAEGAAAARPSSRKRRLHKAKMMVMRTKMSPTKSSRMQWTPCVLTEVHLCTPRSGN